MKKYIITIAIIISCVLTACTTSYDSPKKERGKYNPDEEELVEKEAIVQSETTNNSGSTVLFKNETLSDDGNCRYWYSIGLNKEGENYVGMIFEITPTTDKSVSYYEALIASSYIMFVNNIEELGIEDCFCTCRCVGEYEYIYLDYDSTLGMCCTDRDGTAVGGMSDWLEEFCTNNGVNEIASNTQDFDFFLENYKEMISHL